MRTIAGGVVTLTTERPPQDGDWLPRPDPTVLTTAQLLREMAALKELIFARLDAVDRATALLHDDAVRIPTDTDKQIAHLRELQDEKFVSIGRQFHDRDERIAQAATAQTAAVSAALQAQKEASVEQNRSLTFSIEKSESATAKNIDALNAALQASVNALATQINDGKERLTRIESIGLGRTETRAENRDNNLFGLAVIGGLIALTNLIVGVAVVLAR